MTVARRASTHHSAGGAFDPLSLSPLFWFDASDSASITSSGGLVSQWNDKSGNARHITQSFGGNKPTTGGTQNGLNVLSFDGTDYLTRSGSGTQSAPYTIVAVAKNSSTDGNNHQLVRNAAFSYCGYSDSAKGIDTYSGNQFNSGTAWGTSAYRIAVWVINGASSKIGVDRAAYASGNAGSNALAFNGLTVAGDPGGSAAWVGYVAEIFGFAGAIADADRTSLETYLARWGI